MLKYIRKSNWIILIISPRLQYAKYNLKHLQISLYSLTHCEWSFGQVPKVMTLNDPKTQGLVTCEEPRVSFVFLRRRGINSHESLVVKYSPGKVRWVGICPKMETFVASNGDFCCFKCSSRKKYPLVQIAFEPNPKAPGFCLFPFECSWQKYG